MREPFYIPNNPENKRQQANEGWQGYHDLKDLQYENQYSPVQFISLLQSCDLLSVSREEVWKDVHTLRAEDQLPIAQGLISAGLSNDVLEYVHVFQNIPHTVLVEMLLATPSAEECLSNPKLFPEADFYQIFSSHPLTLKYEEEDQDGYMVEEEYYTGLYFGAAKGFSQYSSEVQELLLVNHRDLGLTLEFEFNLASEGDAAYQRVLERMIRENPNKIWEAYQQCVAAGPAQQERVEHILAGVAEGLCRSGYCDLVVRSLGDYFKGLSQDTSLLLAEAGYAYTVAAKAWCFEEVDEAVGKKLGIDLLPLLRAWRSVGISGDKHAGGESAYKEVLASRMRTTDMLERARPGCVDFLFHTYGISDFERYPKEMLLRQFDERENDKDAWGLLVYARGDWNGALAQQQGALGELYKSSSDIIPRFVECRSGLDVARRLVQMTEYYGDYDYGVFSAHGSEKSVSLSNAYRAGSRLSTAEIAELLQHSSAKIRLPKDVPVAVLSCKGGVTDGVAETIATHGGNTTVGAEQNSNTKSLRLKRDSEGNRWFEVTYANGSAVSYAGGKPVEVSESNEEG